MSRWASLWLLRWQILHGQWKLALHNWRQLRDFSDAEELDT